MRIRAGVDNELGRQAVSAMRTIDGEWGVGDQAALAAIFHYTYNLGVQVSHTHVFADWIFIGKEQLRQSPADNYAPWRCGLLRVRRSPLPNKFVVLVEISSAQQGQADGTKVTGRNHAPLDRERRAMLRVLRSRTGIDFRN